MRVSDYLSKYFRAPTIRYDENQIHRTEGEPLFEQVFFLDIPCIISRQSVDRSPYNDRSIEVPSIRLINEFLRKVRRKSEAILR